MDAAASEFYDAKEKKYIFHKSDNKTLTSEEMVEYWAKWVKNFIVSIETAWRRRLERLEIIDRNDWE